MSEHVRARERWLVDGMNVIGSRPDGWWRDRDRAMEGLARRLDRFARESGQAVVVVFDSRPRHPLDLDAVEVLFARSGGRDAADDEIARIVGADPDPASLRVVTSDSDLAKRVEARGATVFGAGSFRRRLERDAAGD